MVIEFEKVYLKELYEQGRAKNKKYRFPPPVIKQYIKTVDILMTAPYTEFLYKFKSLHYEKKGGDLKNVEAVYVNEQYRLEFKSYRLGENPTQVICSLTALSLHYKKK